MPRLRALPPWCGVAALVAVSTILRFRAALDVPVPWIAPDEIVYAELGRNLWESGRLGVLGEPTGFYSLVYPALAGLPLSLGDLELGYTVLKALQALVMSLASVPVYLWSRSLMPRGWALVAAALTVAVPGLAYSGLVMTEVAFYPVMTLAAWAMARALAEPTARSQALLVAAVAAASATRLQAAVLVPAFVTAVALAAALDRSAAVVRRLAPALLGLAALAAAWSAWHLRDGGSWAQVFAAYQAAGASSYEAGEVARFVWYHAGAVVIMTGLFPVCALALLAVGTARDREPSPDVRAYVAVAVSLVAWLVLEVGVFASTHVGRLAERDLLALAPLLFVGLALWLARGAPRPRVATSLVALTAAATVLTLPVGDLVVEAGLQDSFSLIGFYRLGSSAEAALYGGAAAAAILFALVPRRLVAALPAALAAWLVAASFVASDEVADRSSLTQQRLLGPEPRWVDRAGATGVAYLYDGDPYWNAVWEHVFWNRKIDRIYDLPGKRVPGPIPQQTAEPQPDGRLVLASGEEAPARRLVASTSLTFVGERLAETRQEGITQAGLALWQLDPPARLATRTTGVRTNGDVFGKGVLRVYDCNRGAFELQLLGKSAHTVELKLDGKVLRTFALPSGETWGGAFAAPPKPGETCTFEITADGVVGATRFAYVR